MGQFTADSLQLTAVEEMGLHCKLAFVNSLKTENCELKIGVTGGND